DIPTQAQAAFDGGGRAAGDGGECAFDQDDGGERRGEGHGAREQEAGEDHVEDEEAAEGALVSAGEGDEGGEGDEVEEDLRPGERVGQDAGGGTRGWAKEEVKHDVTGEDAQADENDPPAGGGVPVKELVFDEAANDHGEARDPAEAGDPAKLSQEQGL